jgi:hypothetical protein
MRLIGVITTLLLFIVAVRLCLVGDQMWDEANIFPAPERVSYQKFTEERPLRGWYRIDDGWIDAAEGAYGPPSVQPQNPVAAREAQVLLKSRQVYVPLHRTPLDKNAADIIVLTTDPDLTTAVKNLINAAAGQAHVQRAPRMVQGMVRLPGDLPEEIRAALGPAINTQSTIIEEYVAPSHKHAATYLGSGGAILLFLAIGWLIVWKTEKPPILVPEEMLDYDVEDIDEDEAADYTDEDDDAPNKTV